MPVSACHAFMLPVFSFFCVCVWRTAMMGGSSVQ